MRACNVERRLLALSLLTGLVLFVPACARRQTQNERLQKQWNTRCKEAADLLTGVTDVPSAKAAEPKLKAALREMARLNEQLEETYDPEDVDPKEARGMNEQVGKGIEQMQRLTMETLRIGKNPELSAALGDAWKLNPSVAILEANGAIPKSK